MVNWRKKCIWTPLGLEEMYGNGKVYKLKTSLYGLNQQPRAYFERFTPYCQSQGVHTKFFRNFKNGRYPFL